MQTVPEAPRVPDALTTFTAKQARQLLADIEALDYSDTSAAYTLIGRATVVIDSLLGQIGGRAQ